MKGEFENIWKDAFEGAAVTPSEDVWAGITSRLDGASGKRNWVTILLIAATVTLAFAFPLTVGNSEYEFKPQARLFTADKAPESSSEAIFQRLKEPSNQLVQEPLESSDEPVIASALTPGKDIDETLTNDAGPTADPSAFATVVETKGVQEYQFLQVPPGSLADNYYILPIFRKDNDNYDRTLLAYGNINMGSQSASAGFAGLNLLAASADFESAPNLSNGDIDNRSEDGGATFYIGLGTEIPVARRINLTAGVGYQNQRLNGTSNTIFEENGQQYPLGIYDAIRPGTIYLAQNYDYISNNQFISLPVGAKYVLIDKQIKLRFGLGVSPDFMLSHKVSAAEYGTNKTGLEETAYNTVQFTGLLNLDVLIPLHTSYGLAIETGVRQGLIPYVRDGAQYTTNFNFGVILFYQLKK